MAQYGAAKPTWHSHAHRRDTRSHTQRPRPWHPLACSSVASAQALRPQSSPAYPRAHTQPRTGSHLPCPEQSPGHVAFTTSQLVPPKPSRQAQTPPMHSPRPEQSKASGQRCGGGGGGGGGTGSAQSVPVQPAAQAHRPPAQRPWPEQRLVQVSRSHPAPRQPRMHEHTMAVRNDSSTEADAGATAVPCCPIMDEDEPLFPAAAAMASACQRGTHQPWPEQLCGHVG